VESIWVHSALRPPIGLSCQPGWLWWWRNWWNDDWQGKPKYSEKTCPSATSSITNPTCSAQTRTRAAAVGSQLLTAWATARPFHLLWLCRIFRLAYFLNICVSIICLINYIFSDGIFSAYIFSNNYVPYSGSWDISVGVATGWTTGVRFLAGARDFSLLHSI
jgi:hypothetical protein